MRILALVLLLAAVLTGMGGALWLTAQLAFQSLSPVAGLPAIAALVALAGLALYGMMLIAFRSRESENRDPHANTKMIQQTESQRESKTRRYREW